jgi:hypothetical protein
VIKTRKDKIITESTMIREALFEIDNKKKSAIASFIDIEFSFTSKIDTIFKNNVIQIICPR